MKNKPPSTETATHCQYIGADKLRVGCCKDTTLHNHSSYCLNHYMQVYQGGTARRVRHKDIRRANQIWDLASEMDQAIKELTDEGFDI